MPQAIADFSAAIAIDPINAGYYHERGRCYHALHAYDSAIADFYEAIELEPDNAQFYSSRGESYCLKDDYRAIDRRSLSLYHAGPHESSMLLSPRRVLLQGE